MFALSLEYLKNEVGSQIGISPTSRKLSDTKLTLPLERTALEQIDYTKWYYGPESTQLINVIKQGFNAEPDTEYLRINKDENSFIIHNPLKSKGEEFFFLFDYIKDKVIERGFELKDAIQEAISNSSSYIEFEIFYLYNEETKQYITLEVRSYKGVPMNITGQCTFGRDVEKPINDSKFIDGIKAIFDL